MAEKSIYEIKLYNEQTKRYHSLATMTAESPEEATACPKLTHQKGQEDTKMAQGTPEDGAKTRPRRSKMSEVEAKKAT